MLHFRTYLTVEQEEFQKNIGTKIKQVRISKGISSSELARLCEMDRPGLVHIEKGRINVTSKTLLRIANALDVYVWELLL